MSLKPAFSRLGIASGEGASIQSTWPDRQQHHLVELRHAGLVPIVLVRRQLGAGLRLEGRELPRAGARRRLRELVPVLADLLPLRRARHHDPGDLVGQEGVGRLGRDLDRPVVDHLVGGDGGNARAALRRLLRVELRGLFVQQLLEVPDHGVGLEVAAVVELHAVAQGEGPARRIGLVDLPRSGEAGHQHRGLVGRGQVPIDQPVIERVAHEPHAFAALVGLAGGQRNVRGGHADAQRALRQDRGRGQRCQQRDGAQNGFFGENHHEGPCFP